MRLASVAKWIGAAVVSYVLAGALLHYLIFPDVVPSSFYPQGGDVFSDASSGERLRVTRRSNGLVEGDITFAPRETAPIPHVHAHTPDESHVSSGQLTARVGGKEYHAGPGQTLTIPPGAAHAVWNSGSEPAVVRLKDVPALDALCRSQEWALANDPARDRGGIGGLLQASLFSPRCDVWTGRAPVWLQRAVFAVVAPTARLLGFRSFYPEFVRHPAG